MSSIPSKSTMKINIVELMDVGKKEGKTPVTCLKISFLGFRDIEKVGGVPNEIFYLIIMVIIANSY